MYWTTDSGGNHLTDSAPMSITSLALESLETIFNQDLNGDGVIGPTKTVIQADGPTSLTQVGSEVRGVENESRSRRGLHLYGASVAVGQFGGSTPIEAEQAAGGYELAWKKAALGLDTYWSTGGGAKQDTESAMGSREFLALESREATCNQDLNGDGVIGPAKTVIQTDGPTSLTQV